MNPPRASTWSVKPTGVRTSVPVEVVHTEAMAMEGRRLAELLTSGGAAVATAEAAVAAVAAAAAVAVAAAAEAVGC